MNQMLNDLLRDNNDFRVNVQQSMLDYSAIVVYESTETVNHINRAVLAKCVLKSADMATDLFLNQILQTPFTTIPELSDIYQITVQAWDAVANIF